MIKTLIALLILGSGSFFWAKPCMAHSSSQELSLGQDLAESPPPSPVESDILSRMDIGVHLLLLGQGSFGSFPKESRNNGQESSLRGQTAPSGEPPVARPSPDPAPAQGATPTTANPTQRQENIMQMHNWLGGQRRSQTAPSGESPAPRPSPDPAPAQEPTHQPPRKTPANSDRTTQKPRKRPKVIPANPNNAQGLRQDGFYVQEAELHFKAGVDDYWSGNLSLGIEWHPGGQGFGAEHFDWNLEEAFVESRFMPSWVFKIGKFYAHLGSHNRLHTHDWSFPSAPLIYQTLFVGHARLSGTGLSLSFMPSLPWDLGLTAQVFYSSKGGQGFSKMKNLSALLFMENTWDFSKRLSAEWNMAFGSGVHSVSAHGRSPIGFSSGSRFSRIFKRLYSSSFVLKYYLRGRIAEDPFLSWTTELLQGQGQDNLNLSAGGLSSWLKWRFLNSWLLQARAEYIGQTAAQINNHRYSLLGAFKPTDRSALRLQYSYINKSHRNASAFKPHSLSFQAVMSWGSSH